MSRSLARGLGGCLRDALARGDAARAPRGALARPLARGFRGTATAGEEGEGDESSWTAYEDPPPLTPWVRSVISGVELLRNPRYNKGMSFSDEERDKMHLQGLLPPAKFSQHTQVQRVMRNVRALGSPVEQHFHLLGLLERNERLFHRVLMDHVEELLPVMYTPTVGQVCKKFSVMFNRPRGLYITSRDKGSIYHILKNWPEKYVKLVVVTDGERVMGLGDLGVQGMGVAAAKSKPVHVDGRRRSRRRAPRCLDVGTNNQELLNDPLYVGNKMERITGEARDELLDEFIDAVKRRFGERCIVQFEDFSNTNGKRLLERYATQAAIFNDDIHGVAATTLAGIIAATPKTGHSVDEHTYLIAGAGETGTGIGEMIAEYVAQKTGVTVVEARKKIFMVDSKGLVTRARAEKEMDLALHKLPYGHDSTPEADTVLEAVQRVRPTAPSAFDDTSSVSSPALWRDPRGKYGGYKEDSAGGVAGVAALGEPPRLFTEEVLREMGNNAEHPLGIFALSRPEGISECTAKEAYDATEGRCVFASGCPVEPFVDAHTGKRIAPRPSTSAFVFPGFAFGLTPPRRTACADRCSSPPPRRWRVW